jgi:hypothetical protein
MTFLVKERTAALISFSRPSNSVPSAVKISAVAASVAALRSAFSAIVLAFARLSVPTASTRARTSSP